MMYYVKQSDPINGLFSCPPLFPIFSYHHTQIHTHLHTEPLDVLSVIELWRGSAVTTSAAHPGEGWREREAN